MAFGRIQYREIGFLEDPNTCDLSILRYFVNSNQGKFLDARHGMPFEELQRIYKKREQDSYKPRLF